MPDLWDAFLTNDQRVTHKWKHYFPIYEDHFRRFQNTDVVLIEIGCYKGGSLQLWKRFLGPHARIIGIDIDPACAAFTEDQIDIRIGDQSDAGFLRQVVAEFGAPDIVIDDGSHMMSHIRASFDCLYELVSRNGVYLVESLHTAYWEEHEGGLRRKDSFIERCKDFIDELNADWSRSALSPTDFTRSTLSMHFYDSVVAFEKGRHTTKRGLQTGRDTAAGAPDSLITLCNARFGDCRIQQAEPRIEEIENAVYMPLKDQIVAPDWGLYRRDGCLVEDAAYKRGPGRQLVGQSDHLALPPDFDVVHDEMIYGGAIQVHYGHFLVAMLPRYWIDFESFRDRKILVHSQIDLDLLFTFDFIRDIFGALGLERSRFVTLDRPSLVAKVVVPEALFQEQSSAHPRYAHLCETINARLNGPTARSGRAVYLSKEKLTGGVWGVANENAISTALAAKGVDIAFPELLPFREQVLLFEKYETVCALVGSALHTSLFARGSNKIVALNHNASPNTNHLIVDGLKHNDSTYVYPRDGMVDRGPHGGYASLFECPDPKRVADELYALI